ncbi:MAG: DsrE family protein [Cytophagales bacterium]|nr:DsrE family protein [Cytophagales bacterium]
MKKTVVLIFNDNDAALNAGSHVAVRMSQVNKEAGVELEVFLFGPGQAAYSSNAETGIKADYIKAIDELVAAGIKVGTCKNTAEAKGTTDALKAKGLNVEFARDAFLRFGAEGAAVITF